MHRLAIDPEALAAKVATFKHWQDCKATLGRAENLAVWQTTRGADGRLHVSSQMRGPDPAGALTALVAFEAMLLSQRTSPAVDDVQPRMDLSQPGRVAAVWRLAGVWVEVWHPDTAPAVPAPAQRSRRRFLRGPGGRLPFTRRRKETTTP